MVTRLKFGLTSVTTGYNSHPEIMARIAHAAEDAGFDSIWAGHHPFLSERQTRIPPRTPFLDPIVALTFIAARTRTIRLGTGVLLLPQFNPVIVAKELASLDVLSGGRLIVGIGVGWSEHEYEVLGIPYHDRGARADDYLRAMRALWSQDKPAHNGPYVTFGSLQANPRPVQQPNPPIVIGGGSGAAYRRAVEQGNGWFGYGLDLEETKRSLAGLREAARKHSRPAALGVLEVSVAPRVPVDMATARQFSELGVHRLILISPQNTDATATGRIIETARDTLIGQV